MGTPVQTLPISEASLRQVDLIGVFRYANQYPTAIEMIATGQVDIKPLITRKYPLSQTKAAFEDLRAGNGIKLIVKLDES